MTYLKKYIEYKNNWSKIMGRSSLDIHNLTNKQIIELARLIDFDLNPTQLTCNGKIRGHTLFLKTRMLNDAMSDLEKLADCRDIKLVSVLKY